MWDLWWTKWHWDGFFPRILQFYPVNFIPPVLHYLEKLKKNDHLSLHLHHKGCTKSLKAAGPFTTIKIYALRHRR